MGFYKPGANHPTDPSVARLHNVIWTLIFGLAFGFFKVQNTMMKGGIRSSEADEIEGLDLPEMGVLAYPEFAMADVEKASV